MTPRQALKHGQYPDDRLTEQQRAIQVQKNEQRQDQEFEAEVDELEEMQDAETVPNPDSPEVHEVDNLGDSDAFSDLDSSSAAFDLEWIGALPRVQDLPYRAKPWVFYRLNKDFELVSLVGSKKYREARSLRDALAMAVAEHIKRSGVQFTDPGDWVNIPAITRDALINLAPKSQDELRNAMKNRFRQLKSFAIALPNDDIVTIEVLVHRGVTRKAATRGAALRLLAAGVPREELAGEEWTKADWRQLKENERESKRRTMKKTKRPKVRTHD